MKKRSIALMLALVTICTVFTSCSRDKEDKGAIVPMYIGNYLEDYDPQKEMTDIDTIRNLGLLFEGLTTMDEDGKVSPALAKEWYTKIDEARNEYFLYFELNKTAWSDGRQLTADDFLFAWRRLLSPETDSPYACLLYQIKNAKAAKSGAVSIDEVGIASADSLLLEVEFEGPFDLDLFLEYVSSPALAPLREDIVTRPNDTEGIQGDGSLMDIGNMNDTWATSTATIATVGPFTLKSNEYLNSTVFERSGYYFIDQEDPEDIMTYVTPWRLYTDHSKSKKDLYESYKNEEIFYYDGLTKEQYEEQGKKVEKQDLLSSYTYYFNTKDSLLSNAKVRKALSISLNREKLAEVAGCGAKVANGFVTEAAFGTKNGKYFREENDLGLNLTGDIDGAKALLKEAGVNGGKITISIKSDETAKAIAEAVTEVWNSLGFKVTVDAVTEVGYKEILAGKADYQVLGLCYQSASPDAYSFLAPFARYYSGEKVDINGSLYTPHLTGFESDEYDSLIDEATAAATRKERSEKLAEAEKLFMELSPAVALYFNTDTYLINSDLDDVKSNFYGGRIFTKADLSGYKDVNEKFLKTEEESNNEEETTTETTKAAKPER